MIIINADRAIVAKFNALRVELADRAFELECQGRCDAADITNELGVRLAEFAQELALAGSTHAYPGKLAKPSS